MRERRRTECLLHSHIDENTERPDFQRHFGHYAIRAS